MASVKSNASTRQFALKHRDDDLHRLLLQQDRYPDVDMAMAVTQIEGWRIAREKLPTWAANDAIVYPPRLAMEQCSSELTARYKASLVSGTRLADLTGGFGVDCAFMSESFKEVTYIERNEELFTVSSTNFISLGLSQITPVLGDGREVLHSLAEQDWIYIDPARRSADGRKVAALSDCEPDVVAMKDKLLAHASRVMVKCSPMLDITQTCKQLHSVREIHVVAVRGECKELLFILDRKLSTAERKRQQGSIPITCIDLTDGTHLLFTRKEEVASPCPIGDVSRYLYEPGVTLLKAGCFRLPAARFNLLKLHPNTHLYTSDTLHADFPGRIFEVVDVVGFSKKELHRLTDNLSKANLAVRNFPQSVDVLRRKLRITEGGDDYLYATTTKNGEHWLIHCRKVQIPPSN
jgi:16S rRNA G966 N2-methylase RsmD